MDAGTFTVATPDAVLGGRLDFVWERLAAHGFEVRAAVLVGLDFPRLSRMYAHQDDPPPMVGRTQLPEAVMAPLYRYAPACVLAVHRPSGDAHAALLRCKGATRPEAAAPDSVRARGEHVTFNFQHAPDDPESAAIELGYLVGDRDAARLLEAARAPEAPAWTGLCGLAALPFVLPAFAGPEALSFPFVTNRLRCRLVQRLAMQGVRGLAPAWDALVRERELLAEAHDAAARLAVVRRWDPAGLRGHDPAVDAALLAFAELLDPAGRRPYRALLESGAFVSELEGVAIDAFRRALWSTSDDPRPLDL